MAADAPLFTLAGLFDSVLPWRLAPASGCAVLGAVAPEVVGWPAPRIGAGPVGWFWPDKAVPGGAASEPGALPRPPVLGEAGLAPPIDPDVVAPDDPEADPELEDPPEELPPDELPPPELCAKPGAMAAATDKAQPNMRDAVERRSETVRYWLAIGASRGVKVRSLNVPAAARLRLSADPPQGSSTAGRHSFVSVARR